MSSSPGSVGLARAHPLTKPRLWSLPARLGPVTVHPTRWGVGPQVLAASVKAFTHRWSFEWEIEQISFAGGNWSTLRILAVRSSNYFGSMLQVLAVFSGSIYSRCSSYCKVFRMFVRRVLLVYSGFCILLIIFPALAVFGPSVLVILPVLAVLI